MKAIETVFDGHRFRSRAEARWAVFFKTLGIPYEYEKEGFDLGGGLWYLPDFWLPDQKIWFEVKGQDAIDEEVSKMGMLVDSFQDPSIRGVLMTHFPMAGSDGRLDHDTNTYFEFDEHLHYLKGYYAAAWTLCPVCSRFDIFPGGIYTHMNCRHMHDLFLMLDRFTIKDELKTWWNQKVKEFGAADDTPRLLEAYDAARQARFEHGQIGAPSEWKERH